MDQDKTIFAQMPEVSVSDSLHAIRRVIERGCRLLDAENYSEWVAAYADDFKYSIRAYSPEIRSEVTWLTFTGRQFSTVPGSIKTNSVSSRGYLFCVRGW